jgi:colanic acid biosynthesis glycosyl transferase WcaI
LTIGLSAWIIGRIRRAPFVYNVQEIYPDIAINLGAIRNDLLIRSLFALERFVYRRASRVTVIASQMRACLIEKQVKPEKIIVIPNFVDLSDFTPLAKDNGFSRKYNIHDKFLISYAGNMGSAQQLEVFVEAANILRNETRIHFLMLGDGTFQSTLQRQVKDYNLPNFTFLSYQPYSLMPQVYAASDLCLVPLASQAGCVAAPSKVYRILACARPILAIADADTDLGKLILEVKCGAVIAPDSPVALANAILEASCNSEKWKQSGKNGCAHVIENYSRSSVTNQYNDLIEEVLFAKKVPASC